MSKIESFTAEQSDASIIGDFGTDDAEKIKWREEYLREEIQFHEKCLAIIDSWPKRTVSLSGTIPNRILSETTPQN